MCGMGISPFLSVGQLFSIAQMTDEPLVSEYCVYYVGIDNFCC
jgi:hypothetical protein